MEDLKCVIGCKQFAGGELLHHESCPHYPDSLSKLFTENLKALKSVKLCLHVLTRVLGKKQLTSKEAKLVDGAKIVLKQHFDVTDVLR
ncbi:hypothetical protein GCM10027299_21300 [Larkinella ripae]